MIEGGDGTTMVEGDLVVGNNKDEDPGPTKDAPPLGQCKQRLRDVLDHVRGENRVVGFVRDPGEIGGVIDVLPAGCARLFVGERPSLLDLALPDGPLGECAVVDGRSEWIDRQWSVVAEEAAWPTDLETCASLEEPSAKRIDPESTPEPMPKRERKRATVTKHPDLDGKVGQHPREGVPLRSTNEVPAPTHGPRLTGSADTLSGRVDPRARPPFRVGRARRRRPAPGVRRRLRGPHGARHRRGRLHGLAPHGGARPPRRARARVRPRDLERRVEQHLAPALPGPRALRRPDRQDLDRLPRQGALPGAGPPVRLPPRRAGARRRVVAPALRDRRDEHDRHAQPAPVGRRSQPRAGEVRHRRHLGGVRQPAGGRRPPPRLGSRRRPDPARALADQPEVDLRDRQGRRRLPDDELPRRVRRPRRRHAHVQQLRPAPEPALRHRHDHHAGARARDDRARLARAAPRFLLLHRRGSRPSHRRGAGHSRRRLRLRTGREHLDGGLGGPDPAYRPRAGPLGRRSRDRHHAASGAPRVERGHGAARRLREAQPRDGVGAARVVGRRRREDDRVVRREPRALARPRRLDDSRADRGDRFDMRTLVTGGGGFLGSHLVERLESDGHDVFAARQRDYDLTRFDDTERLFAEARPESVFHLAAEVGGIGANRANPGRYWYANLVMGAHVLEQSRLHEVGKLVIAGTVCAYPKFTPVPFHEADLWQGYPEETNAPYGVAKKSILVGAQAYREQYGLDSVFLLPTNLYGPRDHFHPTNAHVIPDLIRKMVEGSDEIVLWGDGSP